LFHTKNGTMSNKSITMVQIRRILQLLIAGNSIRQISKQLGIHRNTINVYLIKFDLTQKTYTELLALDDFAMGNLFYLNTTTQVTDSRYETINMSLSYFVEELKRPGVTRQLLWQEYRTEQPEGYSYSQFCEHLIQYRNRFKATMHLNHQAGEFLQIDFAGKTLHYIDKQTGEIIECPVLVCTLPFSNYTYVEALACSKQEYLFTAMNNCLVFLGGVPRNILSDNMKQYVQKNSRYEYVFQDVAMQWSVHYNTNLDATRPRKPKDKPSVENHVYISYLRIYAKLRNQEFYSLAELNFAIRKLLVDFNKTAFQKLPGSRTERFLEQEKKTLTQLPETLFTIQHITKAKVQMNYHVILGEDNHQYSVPHQYIGQQTKIIYDQNTVEIYIDFKRIAIHPRSDRRNGYSTIAEHMPANHLHYLQTRGWDADYFLSIASKIGVNSIEVFKHILESKDFVEQTYKACVGLKRLAGIYSNERFEAACLRALAGTRINYWTIKNILENNLDKQKDAQLNLYQVPPHDNLRGPKTYN
jgi:transposase